VGDGARVRLDGMLRATQMITDDVALPVVLRNVVEAARELLAAEHGALTLLAPAGGTALVMQAGVAPVAGIADLVAAAGLLDGVSGGPAAVVSPDFAGTTLLGSAIRVHGDLVGTLFVCGTPAPRMQGEDEELLASLAATAGVAIENARLLEEAQRRHGWLEAATDITRRLLSDVGEDPLSLVARRVGELAGADSVNVVLPTPDRAGLLIAVATGLGATELTGVRYPMAGTASETVLGTARPLLVTDPSAGGRTVVQLSRIATFGPLMVLPLAGVERVRGTLVVGRLTGRPAFTPTDLQLARAFANHAAIALELTDARADRERLALARDRERIARDLHDHVVQRLFGAGLTAQSVVSRLASDPRADRLADVVADIDQTLRQIRTTIFALRDPDAPGGDGIRAAVAEVVTRLTPALGVRPGLVFTGPVELAVPDQVVDDLLAVVAEGLTNVGRHADAHRVEVMVEVRSGRLRVVIIDDGRGMGGVTRRSGLANLRQRAEDHGGRLDLARCHLPGVSAGTRLRWEVPLSGGRLAEPRAAASTGRGDGGL